MAIRNMEFSEIITIITVGILTDLLSISLLQFSSVKKSIRIQREQHVYARIIKSRMNLENTEVFTKMVKEIPLFAEGLDLVDNPNEYYTLIAYLNLIEFLFHQYNTEMMDTRLWPRWKALAETLMYISKLKRV